MFFKKGKEKNQIPAAIAYAKQDDTPQTKEEVKYYCPICGYVAEKAPERCPVCRISGERYLRK